MIPFVFSSSSVNLRELIVSISELIVSIKFDQVFDEFYLIMILSRGCVINFQHFYLGKLIDLIEIIDFTGRIVRSCKLYGH